MTLHSVPEPRDIHHRASDWVALIATDPTPANISAAREWCEQDPAHRDAFEHARWLFTASGKLKAPPKTSRRVLPYAAAATVLIAIAVAWLVVPDGDYHNGNEPMQRVTLADGSVATLDVDSAIDLHYTPQRRELEVLHGTALFEVVHDTQRPFVVRGMNVSATALGTIYAVQREPESITVVVKQGVVRVDAGQPGAVDVRAGQSVRYNADDGLSSLQPADAETALAWSRGRLKFELTPLHEVVAQINRYRPGYIVITDPALKDLPVSGVFRTDRLDDALTMLEEALQIKVRRLTDYLVLVG